MSTGPCGIDCDVCRLRLQGICSSCGPGRGSEAAQKEAAQRRLLGSPCPILACAVINGKDYCLRDCAQFPCENFTQGPYPFAEGFLAMQRRRRGEPAPFRSPDGLPLEIPRDRRLGLKTRDRLDLCNLSLTETDGETGLVCAVMGRPIRLDLEQDGLWQRRQGAWIPVNDPLLELLMTGYFEGARRFHPLEKEPVGVGDLREAHYFGQGHPLPLQPLVERYGCDPEGFAGAAESLGGEAVAMADAAYRFSVFPRVPVHILLWTGDTEFAARAAALFDRSIEAFYAAPLIWLLVRWVVHALICAPPLSAAGKSRETPINK